VRCRPSLIPLLLFVSITFSTAQKLPAAKHTVSHPAKPAPIPSSDSELKLPAHRLLAARNKTNYAAVESIAAAHKNDQLAQLAWMVLGQAHSLDGDWKKAADAFRHSRGHAAALDDYSDALLATTLQAQNDSSGVIETLADFEQLHPGSIWARDMSVVMANALLESNRQDAAAGLLVQHRAPYRSDIELSLGRAWIANTQTSELGIGALRDLYFDHPLANESQIAGQLLRGAGRLEDAPSYPRYRTRIASLIAAKKYADAEDDLHELIKRSDPVEQPFFAATLALTQYKANKIKDAKRTLSSLPAQPLSQDVTALRLYVEAGIARSEDDDTTSKQRMDDFRAAAPGDPLFRDALIDSGNHFLLKQDLATAEQRYYEAAIRFPNSGSAAIYHWKASWLSYRLGRKEEAAQRFEAQITKFPGSPDVPAALYWLARLYAQQGNTAAARAIWSKLSDRYRNYYYSELARRDLRSLSASEGPAESPASVTQLLDALPPTPSAPTLATNVVSVDDPHLRRARLLASASLTDFAVHELQAASQAERAPWALAETARILISDDRIHTALRTVKTAVPNYSQWDFSSMPREIWETLFPRPHWQTLVQQSQTNKLDPALMAALIRQESEFNPGAVSPAKALGLMQILPSVGKQLAKQTKMKGFNANKLFDPDVNIKLGTKYFREITDAEHGEVVYALAAYNAGESRVTNWRAAAPSLDTSEFVESIPFTETREYVMAILRNQMIYKKLYGNTP